MTETRHFSHGAPHVSAFLSKLCVILFHLSWLSHLKQTRATAIRSVITPWWRFVHVTGIISRCPAFNSWLLRDVRLGCQFCLFGRRDTFFKALSMWRRTWSTGTNYMQPTSTKEVPVRWKKTVWWFKTWFERWTTCLS